jgi:diguanylate cyclase (GGDEF)-like protein
VILAVSRFRVANGMEAAVSEAFVNRPGLVEAAAGFLGLETYTDSADPKTFWLVTRWADARSFKGWHRSEAHHASHGAMPSGLKLDASATQLNVLDRIEGPEGPTLAEALHDDLLLLSAHAGGSEYLYWLQATLEGTILACSGAFTRDFASNVVGRAIASLIPPSDADAWRALRAASGRELEPVILNFLDAAGNPFSLRCRVAVRPGRLSLVGEPFRRHEEALRDELVRLSNEQATLSREDARKARALTRALGELQEANRRITEMARTDSLTGLANRRDFDEVLVREVARARRSGGHLVLALADVDHFKRVNDDFGHPVGDAVLEAVGGALRSALRPYDHAARYGGEELALLLPDTSLEQGSVVAERVRAAVASLVVSGCGRPVTVSLGVAELAAGEDGASLLGRCDTALYAAKNAGRDRVVRSGEEAP